jgi:hypothetical protein
MAVNRPLLTWTFQMSDALKVLGRTIGTHNGWDGDMDAMVFYDFKPCDVLADDLPAGDLNVDFQAGDFSYYDDDGNVTKTLDMLPILTMVKRDA